ncbi:hypothetical protein [Limnoglobus roseus]|uniref:PH domain-containing protein n=1 Tax=Limnoglobus roseus TaxID=2598579 RepID=A0A5C1ANP8_9BACT|nr:hypothetical protein [Limnoglobus roseus]QEL19372.1 hypothetical protein PX52LOC_06443 [Limnoglobus roseus]
MPNQNPTMTIRPLFNLGMAGGLFVLMIAVPAFTDLPFLSAKYAAVYMSVITSLTVAFLLYLVSMSYQWIELDGEVIRGRKLISRRLHEWPVNQVVEVSIPSAEPTDGKPKSQNYRIGFEDGTSIILVAGEMNGIAEFMAALARVRPVPRI